MKNSLKTTITATLTFAALALAGCEPGAGGELASESGSDGTENTTTETDPCAEGNCFAAVEIIDDLNNPTLAPTCDKGSPYSPGADIDGAVLADADGVIFATLGNCSLTTQPTSCE